MCERNSPLLRLRLLPIRRCVSFSRRIIRSLFVDCRKRPAERAECRVLFCRALAPAQRRRARLRDGRTAARCRLLSARPSVGASSQSSAPCGGRIKKLLEAKRLERERERGAEKFCSLAQRRARACALRARPAGRLTGAPGSKVRKLHAWRRREGGRDVDALESGPKACCSKLYPRARRLAITLARADCDCAAVCSSTKRRLYRALASS